MKPVLSIPDTAVRPTHPAIVRVSEQIMRRRMFGDRMKATFRARLLLYSSFTTIKLCIT